MLLPWLTVWFSAGLGIGSYLPYFPILTSLLLLSLAGALVWHERSAKPLPVSGTVSYGSLLLGIVYWTLFATMTQLPDRPGDVASPVRIMGRVVEPVRHFPEKLVVVLEVSHREEAGSWVASSQRIKLTWWSPDVDVYQGDVVEAITKLRRPSGTLNPRGFDYEAYLEGLGIHAVASVSGPHGLRILASGQSSFRWALWNRVDRWRGQLHSVAVQSLHQPALGLFLGLIIGERGYLDPEMRDRFMTTGTVHILSISGSHLGLIALLSYLLLRQIGLALPAQWLLWLSRYVTPSRLAALLSITPVAVYALLAGAETATVRSLIMIGFAVLALWCGHRHTLPHALSVAGLVILLHDPRALFDISFQLSYISVCAIAGTIAWRQSAADCLPREQGWAGTRGARWITESLWIAGAVTVATLPLVAFYFNQIPWMGLWTNLLVVPFVGGVLVPIGLCASLWALLSGGSTLPAAPVLQAISDAFVTVVDGLANVPGAEWRVSAPTLPTIILFYALTWFLLRTHVTMRVRTAAVVGIVVLLGWWGWSPRWLESAPHLQVTFLDVGQGDSTVIEFPGGGVVLIDGGARYERYDVGLSVVAPYLWNRGIQRIDHMIGTHPQLDHVGGLASLLHHFPVERYWGNGVVRQEAFWSRLANSIKEQGLAERVAQAGQEVIQDGPCRLTIMHPTDDSHLRRVTDGTRSLGSALNNLSIVLHLECRGYSFLFPGDIEREGLKEMTESGSGRPVTVLKVPHHGARSSLDHAWLARVNPRLAIMSVGRTNPYRHPARLVLDAYRSFGVPTLRTDRDGAVWIRVDLTRNVLTVHTAREQMLRPAGSFWSMDWEYRNLQRLWDRWNRV